MKSVGIDYDILEPLFDSTFELFETLRKAMEAGTANESTLLQYFNDENVSDSIVYHFKVW
jgi:hypothetical protein